MCVFLYVHGEAKLEGLPRVKTDGVLISFHRPPACAAECAAIPNPIAFLHLHSAGVRQTLPRGQNSVFACMFARASMHNSLFL